MVGNRMLSGILFQIGIVEVDVEVVLLVEVEVGLYAKCGSIEQVLVKF